MKVLFIGGTGIISSACVDLAATIGLDLTLLNRGLSPRPTPGGIRTLVADARDAGAVRSVLGSETFDVVVDWIAYTPEHVAADLALFEGRVGQYVFISSASAYRKPPPRLPLVESSPLENPFWEYSRNKIACETLLFETFRERGFPVTVVRPSHTYDRRTIPLRGRYTFIDRMRRGKKVIVHGDGTSLWVLTHHVDFARAFNGLLGNERAIGEAVHITSDEWLSWNQIVEELARAAGAEPEIVHLPSDVIAGWDADWGAGLLGDKAHSMVFDNSKVKDLVPNFAARIPFSEGADEIMAWHDADRARQVVDLEADDLMDRMLAWWEAVGRRSVEG